jgi:hypothetical protein
MQDRLPGHAEGGSQASLHSPADMGEEFDFDDDQS